jgi:membrane fusion protein (multidrug efflux system)
VSDSSSTAVPAANPARRRRALGAIAAAVLLVGGAYAAWHLMVASHYEGTDNAYVQGNVVQITPQIAGTVLAIRAEDTDFVQAGQPLVSLDPTDARVALEQAEAQLAQTVREVRTLYTNNAALKAQVAARQADVARAEADYARAQDDVRRRAPLLQTGAVGKEEFQHTQAQANALRSTVQAAQSALDAAREQLASNQSLTEGTSVEQHPNVQQAAARVHEAYLALKRSELPAPVSGYVAKRTVQVGQRVQPGAPLMTVVALDRVWVDANFKESQLRQLRIGQPATLKADVYGKKVEYHGRVEGLGAGTGSAFALLPAQNATGNWIKIVQRVPVRIALDPKELQANPLRVGLSMDVEVDVRDASGKTLADAPRRQAVAQTQVFDSVDDQAGEEVKRIIAANLGSGGSRLAAARPAAKAALKSPGVPAAPAEQQPIADTAPSTLARR